MTNNILEFWRNASDDPFDILFKSSPIMMHSIGPDGRLLRVSKFWADTLGYVPEEMIGRQSTDFMTENSRRYAETVALPRLKAEGMVHNVDYEFLRRDGSVTSVLVSAVAHYDDNGNFDRSLSVIFDNNEAKRALALLNQKQRSETIGRLVGGVAHDFNNLLSIIQGSLEFLQEDPDHPDREAYMLDAIRATRRGASLTQQLLSFGRRASLQPSKTDLNRVVRDMDAMLGRLLPATIEFETVTTGGLWDVRVDRHQLDTALLNIANNASHAMPKGGKITIETANIRITEDYVRETNEDINPGRYVMVAVSDTGTGIDPEALGRIFEPYFTTKSVGEGSGMGLSMVQGFVRQSQGFLRVYTEVGFGTTIKLYFPAVGTPGPRDVYEDGMQSSKIEPSDAPEIFVVEDEDSVRAIIANQLRGMGYNVTEASSGDIAHSMLVGGYVPKVMITDVVMPGVLQGPALAEKARRMLPDLQLIFISGYPNEAAINGSGLRTYDTQLVKPISRIQMGNAVRNALDNI